MQQVSFLVRVSLDGALVEHLAARHHKPAGDVVAEILGDVECRLSDAVRFRDGVQAVGIELIAGHIPAVVEAGQ